MQKSRKNPSFPALPNFKSLPEAERQQRRYVRAYKKQAQKRAKRREKILAGLADPFMAAMVERFGYDSQVEDRVPLQLVPTRQLRRRVAELNQETRAFYAEPASHTDELASSEPLPVVHVPELSTVIPAPRRVGGRPRPSTFPLLPLMTDQAQALEDIFRNGRVFDEETGLGRRHRCPCCCPPDLAHADQPLDLHVLPTPAGDLVFRCHRCGWSLDSVEFVQQSRQRAGWPAAADFVSAAGHLAAPLPAAQLAGYQRLARLRLLFEAGRQRAAAPLPPKVRRPPALFGDWALLSTAKLYPLFSNYRLSANLPTDCWARVSVDVFGRWSALHLHHPRGCDDLLRLELRDWEAPATTTFFPGRGSEFRPWSEVILCEESGVALALERGLRGWESYQRWPIFLLERCTAPLSESELPFAYVWAVVRGNRTGRFALPFCTATNRSDEERVRLRRVPEDVFPGDAPKIIADPNLFRDLATAPEYLPELAKAIAAEQGYQPLPVVLADMLDHPGVHLATRHRLLREVSARTGIALEALVQEGLNPWTGGPYALNAVGGTTYIARDGRYWRRGSREKEFTAVTNFRLRLIEDRVDGKGRVTHCAVLEIGEKQIPVSVSTPLLESPKRMLKRLTEEARKAAAEYPVISDAKAKRLLSDLVKATQARPPVVPHHLNDTSAHYQKKGIATIRARIAKRQNSGAVARSNFSTS